MVTTLVNIFSIKAFLGIGKDSPHMNPLYIGGFVLFGILLLLIVIFLAQKRSIRQEPRSFKNEHPSSNV